MQSCRNSGEVRRLTLERLLDWYGNGEHVDLAVVPTLAVGPLRVQALGNEETRSRRLKNHPFRGYVWTHNGCLLLPWPRPISS